MRKLNMFDLESNINDLTLCHLQPYTLLMIMMTNKTR